MSDRNAVKEAYFQALALPTCDVSSDSFAAMRSALERAHKLRQFEIENYWKRGTYFWAFQLAAFTLLGLIWREYAEGNLTRNVLLLPAGLGAVTALVGLLSAKGSKFWQENWESHVDMLEAELEGRLTQIVIAKHGRQWSVSRVNERLFWILLLAWTFMFVGVALTKVDLVTDAAQSRLALMALILSFAIIMIGTRSKLSGMSLRVPDMAWKSSHQDPDGKALDSKVANLVKVIRFRLFGLRIANPAGPQLILRSTIAGTAAEPKQTEA